MLRDGIALAAAGTTAPFARIAAESLRDLLDAHLPSRGMENAGQHVLDSFAGLPVHPDVSAGLEALAELGLRVVTLS
ncbi:hypothetical protein [Leekyejoonella antrihumi]|uniref:hypothetical protein n=1 Tax=Leekyejoonella antrihumi TaxID=1660198 RepID=UPI001C955466|nr:hypothetical protein [Leekyejoonella antrihumi]